ncbi:GTP cyclohydrolase [Diplocarpon mali]|nr:GTP cyclohydrolase [Diplocarpon mali]
MEDECEKIVFLEAQFPLLADIDAGSFVQDLAIDLDGVSWPSQGGFSGKKATDNIDDKLLAKLSGASVLFFIKGYKESLGGILNGAVYQEDHDDTVIAGDIEYSSTASCHSAGSCLPATYQTAK